MRRSKFILIDLTLLKNPIEFTRKLLELMKDMDETVEKLLKDIMLMKKEASFSKFMNKREFLVQYFACYYDYEVRLDTIIRLVCRV